MQFIFRILNHILIVLHFVVRNRKNDFIITPIKLYCFIGNFAQIIFTYHFLVIANKQTGILKMKIKSK